MAGFIKILQLVTEKISMLTKYSIRSPVIPSALEIRQHQVSNSSQWSANGRHLCRSWLRQQNVPVCLASFSSLAMDTGLSFPLPFPMESQATITDHVVRKSLSL